MADGVVIVDKPAGITSHDVVYRLRKILKTKKIGHTGTLDPFATGVLVSLVGKATRLARFVESGEKEYTAALRFGFETDTGDLLGERRENEYTVDQPALSPSDISASLEAFRGEIEQIPPMYSAKRVGGKKLYELARKGLEVKRPSRTVFIRELELLVKDSEPVQAGDFRIRVVCSAGTYIRVLAEDIGRKVGVGCHLAGLRRTRAGRFGISSARTLTELEELSDKGGTPDFIIQMAEAVSGLPRATVDAEGRKRIGAGREIRSVGVTQEDGAPVALVDEEGSLTAVGIFDEAEGTIKPKVVLI